MRGKKEMILGGSDNAAASAKCGGFLGIETEFVDPFPSGPPTLYVRVHLITCGSYASIYLIMPFHRGQRCEDSFCTLVDIRFKAHFGASSERLILDVPCRGPGIRLCFNI